jgi:hypothetical protein
VIPKCLFPEPRPNGINLPTVKACEQCNNVKKSGDDAFLRDFLITDMRCSDHPAAQSLLLGEMGRAMRTNRSDFARATVPHGRAVSLFTPNGLYAGQCYTAPLDGIRINRIFATIARGLYFKTMGRLLPIDTQFEVRRQDPRFIGKLVNSIEPPGAWYRPPSLGDVFTCLYLIGPYEKAESFWLMQFYGGMYISVLTTTDEASSVATATS